MKYPQAQELKKLIDTAKTILIMQADNPDGDSLGSALALEQIFGNMGKFPILYSAIDMPSYLHYLEGWDRVQKDIPSQFDLSIMVDVSADNLFESLNKSNQRHWVASKPVVIIDHHQEVKEQVTYANLVINYPVVATAEVIYELSQQLDWPLDLQSRKMLAVAIMSDSLGLTTESTSARTIAIMSELVGEGVNIAEIENKRRELSRKSPELTVYKGKLLQRIEYFDNNKISIITIPWEEIEKFSNQYNPPMLVMDDMRQTTNTAIAIAFKLYSDGKLTAKIRSNYGYGISRSLAEHFGGGGHKYASGFKITDGRKLDDIKRETIKVASDLIKEADNR